MSETNKRKVKSFSLNADEDKDIIEKLGTVNNVSDYIKILIRNDISNSSLFTSDQKEEIARITIETLKGKPEVIEDEIKRIVMEILKDKYVEIKEEESFDAEAVDALDQFN